GSDGLRRAAVVGAGNDDMEALFVETWKRRPCERRVVDGSTAHERARLLPTGRRRVGETAASEVRMILIVEVAAAYGNCARALRARRYTRDRRATSGVARFGGGASFQRTRITGCAGIRRREE